MVEISEFQRRLWADLDTMPLEEARAKIRLGLYAGKNGSYAAEWLRQRDEAALADFQSEQRDIAISARNAAKDSAFAARDAAKSADEHAKLAREANTLSKIALLIAVVAAVAAALILFD